jgi:LPXTG-site transpeptidase (sortase) family protein
MSSKKPKKVRNVHQKNRSRFSKSVIVGIIFVLIALIIPAKTFAPVIKSEISYQINKRSSELVKGSELAPINTDFSIVIPKINANTKVIIGVDPFNSKIYQQALTQGVAQASTSDTPDQNGNVFIFAHSAGNWYQANQYNAVFYLLNKLKPSDKIFVYFKNKKYSYSVTEVKAVDSKQTIANSM